MNELQKRAQEADTAEKAVALYLEMNKTIAECEEIKTRMLSVVKAYLDAFELDKDFFDNATIGFTNPQVKLSVDEDAWSAAVETQLDLFRIQTEYEKKRAAFIRSSKPEQKAYIRAKKGV